MDSITVSNFRCFKAEQTARLAPITLFVGENSTGKTSLMAMIRALADNVVGRIPNFKEDPYDLGTFDEIVHQRGGSESPADSFVAGFTLSPLQIESHDPSESFRFEVEFASVQATPSIVRRRLSQGTHSIEIAEDINGFTTVHLKIRSREWHFRSTRSFVGILSPEDGPFPPFDSFGIAILFVMDCLKGDYSYFKPDGAASSAMPIEHLALEQLRKMSTRFELSYSLPEGPFESMRPFAGAPTRSQPKRTYDPSRVSLDAEGQNVPSFLAWLVLHEPSRWRELKKRLEKFGRSSGLFDEINVRRLSKTASDPFQVQIRKYTGQHKGPLRNLADVGYGVSQALPLVTDLLRDEGPRMLLLQQPEVHLHPSAEAALASLFCSFVAVSDQRRQLIVETHSDFIIDRVRTSVADKSMGLDPSDVSIVYFERRGLEVHLHSMTVDKSGRIEGAPDGYRDFFTRELQRSIHL